MSMFIDESDTTQCVRCLKQIFVWFDHNWPVLTSQPWLLAIWQSAGYWLATCISYLSAGYRLSISWLLHSWLLSCYHLAIGWLWGGYWLLAINSLAMCLQSADNGLAMGWLWAGYWLARGWLSAHLLLTQWQLYLSIEMYFISITTYV